MNTNNYQPYYYFYKTFDDNKEGIGVVGVDLNFKDILQEYDTLLELTFLFKNTREDGWIGDEDFKSSNKMIQRFEIEMEKFAIKTCGFVQKRFTSVNFYYYFQNSLEIVDKIKDFCKKEDIGYGISEGKEGEFYIKNLLPINIDKRYTNDKKQKESIIFQEIGEKVDVETKNNQEKIENLLEKERDIVHVFYSTNQKSIQKIADLLEINKFKIEFFENNSNHAKYGLRTRHKISLKEITYQALFFEEIAEQFKGEYNGWECSVYPKEEN